VVLCIYKVVGFDSMHSGFWSQLKKPALVLAPMANVTDVAFREVIAMYGKPDVFWTEFVSCNGLLSAGRENLLVDFQFTELQRPIVAQIFGENLATFYECAQLCVELGFDGIDINMGCPDKNVMKQGACGALIDQPDVAVAIIKETQRGAGTLPVSVKTRLGTRKNVIDAWLPRLLETEVPLITVHGRTTKEMSKVPCHWDQIARAVEIVRASGSKTLLFGNGDVKTPAEALKKVEETGVDGVMIGRGIFGNPWLFNRERERSTITLGEKLTALRQHVALFDQYLGAHKPFPIMRKHFASYVAGYPNVKQLKIELMDAPDAASVDALLARHLADNELMSKLPVV
jgi:nifR3 family TIM-barrel protein